MKTFSLAICLLSLLGCATTAKFENHLNSYIGADEEKIIAKWGIPTKTYELKNGKRALEFTSKRIIYVGGHTYATPKTSYQTGKIGDQEFSATSTEYVLEKDPLQPQKLFCKTTFLFDTNGKVESWHHEGNNCVSR